MNKINKIIKNRFINKSIKKRYTSYYFCNVIFCNYFNFYKLDKSKYQIIDIMIWLNAETYHVKKYFIYCFNEFGEKVNNIKHELICKGKYK